MVQQSPCIKVECATQLPDRLESLRNGCFTKNAQGYGYTSTTYTGVHIYPREGKDGCLWTLYIEGGSQNEKLWCRTYYSSVGNGWISTLGGPIVDQAWYVGDYPNTSYYLPMRCVDHRNMTMTQQANGDTQNELRGNLLTSLMNCFVEIRDETRANVKQLQDREMAIVKVAEERHTTGIQTLLHNTSIMSQDLRRHIESRITQELSVGMKTTEEQHKQFIENVEERLVAFDNEMQTEGTYRDTIYTQHEMATEQRLQECMW